MEDMEDMANVENMENVEHVEDMVRHGNGSPPALWIGQKPKKLTSYMLSTI